MEQPLSSGPAPFAEELRAAESAAREAGGIIAGLYQGDYRVEEKSRGNPVTTADLNANRAIREILAGQFPDDAWLSEEDADDPKRLDRSRVWIVDPLDGTREFIRGIPEFCVSIGLAVNGSPVLGVIYHPLRRELFDAVRGGGARLNGEPIQVSLRGTARVPACSSAGPNRAGAWKRWPGSSCSSPWAALPTAWLRWPAGMRTPP